MSVLLTLSALFHMPLLGFAASIVVALIVAGATYCLGQFRRPAFTVLLRQPAQVGRDLIVDC